MNKPSDQDSVGRKLDKIVQLLEDIFILQASSVNMKRQELRKVLGVDMKRVNRISKHLEVLQQKA
ncbi:MAG TPA: hypothetical protein VKV95_17615 [Terriglobia bacterium]|nr:hypothetical protein [Terriglobia bacterium]